MARYKRRRFLAPGRLRDFLLYIAISILVIASLIGVFSTGIDGRWFLKWLSFVLMTFTIVWYWSVSKRRWWTTGKFWAFTGLFLTVHVVCFCLVLGRVDWFKPVWFAMIGSAECVGLMFLGDLLFLGQPKSNRRSRSEHLPD